MKKIIYVLIFLLFAQPFLSFAYDSRNMHPKINENAAKQSVLITNKVLSDLGFKRGLDSEVQGSNAKYTIRRWFEKGGIEEDDGFNFFRHFHDPLEQWSDAGLFGLSGSSVKWAQRDDRGYAWPAARQYFYNALTTGSEEDYARMFQALGQVMHLVADATVPSHVRSDVHPLDEWLVNLLPVPYLYGKRLLNDPYEEWAEANHNKPDKITYTGFPVDLTIFSDAVPDTDAPLPISALWDQNKYNNSNPDPNLTWNELVGLAEFTNANFVSADTQFKKYPHPVYEDTDLYNIDWKNPELIDAEDGVKDKRVYLRPMYGPYQYVRLSSLSYLSYRLLKRDLTLLVYPVLDDKVHEDYASVLIPRAVGYSTALLDYFFRGEIDMIQDPNGGDRYVIQNLGDELMAGEFSLYYDADDGTRKQIGGAPVWVTTKEYPLVPGVPSQSFDFNSPDDAKEPDKYMLVFQGKMGNEEEAVAGKIVRQPQLATRVWFKILGENGEPITPDDLGCIPYYCDMSNEAYKPSFTAYAEASTVHAKALLFEDWQVGADYDASTQMWTRRVYQTYTGGLGSHWQTFGYRGSSQEWFFDIWEDQAGTPAVDGYWFEFNPGVVAESSGREVRGVEYEGLGLLNVEFFSNIYTAPSRRTDVTARKHFDETHYVITVPFIRTEAVVLGPVELYPELGWQAPSPIPPNPWDHSMWYPNSVSETPDLSQFDNFYNWTFTGGGGSLNTILGVPQSSVESIMRYRHTTHIYSNIPYDASFTSQYTPYSDWIVVYDETKTRRNPETCNWIGGSNETNNITAEPATRTYIFFNGLVTGTVFHMESTGTVEPPAFGEYHEYINNVHSTGFRSYMQAYSHPCIKDLQYPESKCHQIGMSYPLPGNTAFYLSTVPIQN